MAFEGYRKFRFRWWRRHLLARRGRRSHGHRQAPSREARAEWASDEAFGFGALAGQMSDHLEPASLHQAHAIPGSAHSDPEDAVSEAGDRTGDSLGGPRLAAAACGNREGGLEEIAGRVPGTSSVWAHIDDRIAALRQEANQVHAGELIPHNHPPGRERDLDEGR